jgi:prevent-host-death family protein
MKRISVSDLRSSLRAFVQKVKQGASFIVVNKNLPVARLVPPEDEDFVLPKEDPPG